MIPCCFWDAPSASITRPATVFPFCLNLARFPRSIRAFSFRGSGMISILLFQLGRIAHGQADFGRTSAAARLFMWPQNSTTTAPNTERRRPASVPGNGKGSIRKRSGVPHFLFFRFARIHCEFTTVVPICSPTCICTSSPAAESRTRSSSKRMTSGVKNSTRTEPPNRK